MILPQERKNHTQVALMYSALNRLRGLDSDLFKSGEPLLSTRLSALITDLQIALENTEEVKCR